jgi:hypothetical protein
VTRRPTLAGRLTLAAVLAVALVLAACGVPTDGETRTLGTPPFGLLTTSTTTPPSTVPLDEGFRLTLYWVAPNDEIVPGEPIGLPETPTFQEVVDLLTEGPPASGTNGSSASSRPGSATTAPPTMRTYITEGLNPEGEDVEHRAVGPLVIQVQDGMLDVLVADRFRDESQATPTRFRLAIAQLVCTVTQFENVDGVRFFDSRGQLTLVNLEQNPIEVATRGNIGTCDPMPPTTTTRAPTTTTSTTSPTTTLPEGSDVPAASNPALGPPQPALS